MNGQTDRQAWIVRLMFSLFFQAMKCLFHPTGDDDLDDDDNDYDNNNNNSS
jgi:hypothetical protein